jgi:hypothetical protein
MVTLESQLSVAVAVPGLRVAEQDPGSVLVVTSFGQVITGSVSSTTVKVVVVVVVLPAPPLLLDPSLAVSVMV